MVEWTLKEPCKNAVIIDVTLKHVSYNCRRPHATYPPHPSQLIQCLYYFRVYFRPCLFSVSGRVYFVIMSVSIFDRVYFPCLLLSKIDVSVYISAFVSIYRVYFYFFRVYFQKINALRLFVRVCFSKVSQISLKTAPEIDAEIDAAPACLFFKIIANTNRKNTYK